jgi:hypothetical protein
MNSFVYCECLSFNDPHDIVIVIIIKRLKNIKHS